ncbi:MAG TPA: serine protease, partial [Thermoleophilaceae bacterium]
MLLLAPSAHAASTNVTPKIVNGGNASVTDFPFQALLYVTGSDPASPAGHPENNGGRFCGGVIRDATHVITAAHCVYDAFNPGQIDNPADVSVLVGTDDLAPQDGTAESAAASSLSFDPNYDPDLSLHDLALVTLATPLYNTPTAQIAPFSGFVTNAELEASSQLTVSGWGDTHSEPGSGSQTPVFLNHLQSAQVPFVQDQTCSSDYTFLDTDLVFCAGDAPGPTIADSCQGDSGGPIVFDTSTTPSHQYVLAGLVDSGFGCAQPHFPGIYTRLDNTDLQVWANGNPPGAPSQTNPATIAGGNQPGDTLTCQPGSWSDSSNLSYQFLDADGDVLGSGQTYTIQASDVGSSILCEVKA